MRTLHLTSPNMTGDDVKDLQALLERHGWLRDKIDGQYGPLTAQAVYRAKYWLGYPHPNQTAGDLLLSYLEGRRKQSQQMLARTSQRMHPVKPPLRQRALNHLNAKLGVKEEPFGSNICWASEWYGVTGPWCAMAVSWAYAQAGSTVFARKARYAYVPYLVWDARQGRNNLTLTSAPNSGDVVAYDWNGDGVGDHCGLFVKWTNKHDGAFVALEGNTAVGNDSNGGEVMHRDRNMSQVQAMIHVGK